MAHLKYLWYVLQHKWFVFVAGRKLGGLSIWRLLKHDLSKFGRAEWGPYVRRFYGGQNNNHDKALEKEEWLKAWQHHWSHNPHHWEYWGCFRNGARIMYDGQIVMPETYIREMIADWYGAGRTKTGSWDITEWYESQKGKFNFHPDTQDEIDWLLSRPLFP